MLRDLIMIPDDRFAIHSEEIFTIDDEIRALFSDVIETMYHNRGIGLTATHIGVHKRLLVIDIAESMYENDQSIIDYVKSDYLLYGGPFFIANPEIIEFSEEKISMSEGSVSLPGQSAIISRSKFITIKFINEKGESKILKAQGWLARCIQHEYDHLNGILYIDYLSKLKREMMIKKSLKSRC